MEHEKLFLSCKANAHAKLYQKPVGCQNNNFFPQRTLLSLV